MIMSTLPRPSTSPAGIIPWMLDLATRTVAYSLNMPEPLLHSTGVFVFAQVQAVENRVGNRLCPIRLLRQLVALCRQPARRSINRPPPKGELR
jgi:hypothetical protein